MVEEKQWPLEVVFWPPYVSWYVYVCVPVWTQTHTYTHTNNKNTTFKNLVGVQICFLKAIKDLTCNNNSNSHFLWEDSVRDVNVEWEKLQNGEIPEGFMQDLLAEQTCWFRTQLYQITTTLDYIYILHLVAVEKTL